MEADEKSAYYNVQLGPQHGEFRKEILQTMQVGLGSNMEADEKSTSNISRI